jgi:hypothetical protein
VAGDEPGAIRAEKGDHSGNVLGPSNAAQRTQHCPACKAELEVTAPF